MDSDLDRAAHLHALSTAPGPRRTECGRPSEGLRVSAWPFDRDVTCPECRAEREKLRQYIDNPAGPGFRPVFGKHARAMDRAWADRPGADPTDT